MSEESRESPFAEAETAGTRTGAEVSGETREAAEIEPRVGMREDEPETGRIAGEWSGLDGTPEEEFPGAEGGISA